MFSAGPCPIFPVAERSQIFPAEPRRVLFCPEEPLSLELSTLAMSTPLPSPGVPAIPSISNWLSQPTLAPGARRRSQSVPKDIGSEIAESTIDGSTPAQQGTPCSHSPREVSTAGDSCSQEEPSEDVGEHHPQFCVDEPLPVEDLVSSQGDQNWAIPSLSPSMLSRLSVQNTFIHSELPPLTPAPGSAQRSRSQPPEASPAKNGERSTRHELSFLPRPFKPSESSCLGESPAHNNGKDTLYGIDASPAFVPLSPALCMTAMTYGPPAQFRVLRLADHL